MPSRLSLAALLAAILSVNAAPAPAPTSGLEKKASTKAPSYCIPDSKLDQFEEYSWIDQSPDCARQGVAQNCCITYTIGGGSAGNTCSDFTDQDLLDLKNAFGQQIMKGQTGVTNVGQWNLGYEDFAAHPVDPNVEVEFFHGLDEPPKEGTASVRSIYFHVIGLNGNGYTSVSAERKCK